MPYGTEGGRAAKSSREPENVMKAVVHLHLQLTVSSSHDSPRMSLTFFFSGACWIIGAFR